jgi:hypothetical protein
LNIIKNTQRDSFIRRILTEGERDDDRLQPLKLWQATLRKGQAIRAQIKEDKDYEIDWDLCRAESEIENRIGATFRRTDFKTKSQIRYDNDDFHAQIMKEHEESAMAMEKPTVDGTKECTGETDFNTKSQFHQGQLDPFLAPISKEAKERTIAKENPTADLIAPNRSRLEPMIARIKESRGRKMAMGNPTAELIARKSKSEAITRLADEFIKEYDELRVPMLKAAQFLAGRQVALLPEKA